MVFVVKAAKVLSEGEEHTRLLSPSSVKVRYDGRPDEDLPKR